MTRFGIFGAAPSLCLAALLLQGCDAVRSEAAKPTLRPSVIIDDIPEWQQAASDEDRQRLGRLDQAWADALAAARKAGFRRAIAAEGALLEPGAALAQPAPGPGSYMCRLIQIGSTARRGRAFAVSEPGFCYVGAEEDGRLWLAKQTGVLRREGYLLADGDARRMIYLGTLAKGRNDTAPSYGEAPERSRGAVLERIGPLRYRLVTPWPAGFMLEVMELTPAPVQREQ